jgi:hypothetical protein
LETVGVQFEKLQELHRDTFKNNLRLKYVYLNGNDLHTLHPKMFSHLKLTRLWLSGNICVNKEWDYPSPAVIEEGLQDCGENYHECPETDECLKALENRLTENFTRQIQDLKETLDQKFELKFEKMEDLYYHLYGRNEDNAKKIREISESVDKILEMLTTK